MVKSTERAIRKSNPEIFGHQQGDTDDEGSPGNRLDPTQQHRMKPSIKNGKNMNDTFNSQNTMHTLNTTHGGGSSL